MPFRYIYIYIQWNSASTTTHWMALNWSCWRDWAAGWGGCVTLAFLKVSCRLLPRSLHLYNSFLDWKLFCFVLRAATAHRCCTMKSHNEKCRRRQYKFQKSLHNKCATLHLHLLRLHSRLHPYIHDVSGQRDAAEQIPADRLPVFQRKDTDRMWWSCYAVLDQQFCNSWTVVTVWIPRWSRWWNKK